MVAGWPVVTYQDVKLGVRKDVYSNKAIFFRDGCFREIATQPELEAELRAEGKLR